jgi:hypothetical protein
MVLGRALGMRFLWTDWTERDPRTVVWTRGVVDGLREEDSY